MTLSPGAQVKEGAVHHPNPGDPPRPANDSIFPNKWVEWEFLCHTHLYYFFVKGGKTLECLSTCSAVPRSPRVCQGHPQIAMGWKQALGFLLLLEQPEILCSYLLNVMCICLIFWTSPEASFAPLFWAQSRGVARMGEALSYRTGNVSWLSGSSMRVWPWPILQIKKLRPRNCKSPLTESCFYPCSAGLMCSKVFKHLGCSKYGSLSGLVHELLLMNWHQG